MRYSLRLLPALTLSVLCLAVLLLLHNVLASSFNPSRIIDDGVFTNASTMNASQIDTFLNSFPSSCISTNNGFSAPDPTGYNPSSGFLFGGNVSAGQVIYDAAQAYGINPQVLLTTLQKEQTLVSGAAGCSTLRYVGAMGYGCPDGGTTYSYNGVNLYTLHGFTVTSVSGTCVNSASKAGFAQQVIHAAWLLMFGEQRSEGNVNWKVTKGNWDNSDDPQSCYGGPMTQGTWQRCSGETAASYDGYTTIDGQSTHIDNGATASLYWYTPHYSGNESFVNIFTSWFGGLYAAPYFSSYVSQSDYPKLDPGQQSAVSLSYQNSGNQPWYDDSAIGSAPKGTYPVHLATSHSLNRASAFGSTWPNYARPAVTFAAVYLSDGTTLAPNQHVAQPGQIVKFSFTITVPAGLTAATYPEYFMPIAEGSSTGLFNDPGTFLNITVNPAPSLTWRDQSGNPTTPPGLNSQVWLRFTNNGNTPLYDDTSIASAPAGTHPVHLATANPINRASDFSAGWPNTSRPAVTFAAVYLSDGTTLAPNQHVAQPGQIVKFSFNLSVPAGYADGQYKEYFQPVLEGTSDGYFEYQGIHYTISVPSTATVLYSQSPGSQSLASNEPASLTYQIKNVGNAALSAGSRIITAGAKQFKNSSWVSDNQIATLSTELAPNQTTDITLSLSVPQVSSTQSLPFDIRILAGDDGILPGSISTTNITVAPPIYRLAFAAQSGYPTLAASQTTIGFISYKNTGNQPWYDDSSIASATWGHSYAVHLATSHTLNRASGFAYGWPNYARPAVTFAAVYLSDGTTLAPNQHVAQPGQIVKFSFNLSPAYWVPSNTYDEYFQPVAEGSADGLLNDVGSFLRIHVVPQHYSDDFYGQSGYPTIGKGDSTTAYMLFKNTGNVAWYDDTSIASAPAGTHPVHLATANPINRASDFSAGWPNTSRPAVTFAAVYLSDGTTLAPNQHVAQPGQIVKFSFNLSVPAGYADGQYKEYFQLVAEGTATGAFNYLGANQVITVR